MFATRLANNLNVLDGVVVFRFPAEDSRQSLIESDQCVDLDSAGLTSAVAYRSKNVAFVEENALPLVAKRGAVERQLAAQQMARVDHDRRLGAVSGGSLR